MRQHVNPLSLNFQNVEKIPPLNEIFQEPKLPLHLDIGCAAGDFLFDLALENKNWNYLGIEIRERLVNNAKSKAKEREISNLHFTFGNANNIFDGNNCNFLINYLSSISFNFPDPWFKKKHLKRRVIQPKLIDLFSNYMQKGTLIFIKTDVRDLFKHMDYTISGNSHFKEIDNNNFDYSNSFNPNKIQTSREKYVISKQLDIFGKIYKKI